jgi:alpha-tubulin suppressor-like RCC1 family protein
VAGGAVRCWGANDLGQLGAEGSDSAVPVQVGALTSGASQVALGASHGCALVSAQVWCWGSNAHGQLGAPAQAGSQAPAQVAALNGLGVQELAAGATFTCARTASSVLCWGADDAGQLGDGGGAARATPAAVPGVSAPRSLSSGGRHACAVGAEGLVCWGADESGQTGNGKFAAIAGPAVVGSGGLAPSFVGLGQDHGCIVYGSGALSCFGLDASSQLGDHGTQNHNQPTRILADSAQKVAGGRAHGCALLSGGAVHCWGANDAGQLGVGDQTPRGVPTAVSLSGAQQVALGSDHSCALLDGGVRCWGKNDRGQLGAGAGAASSNQPVSVSGR